ncbi:M2 family metallopeptidase [bacterium]|nr:M2 family metallopeptidase [bacterium]RQV97937.1 MAG: peptidase M3 [bacterium]
MYKKQLLFILSFSLIIIIGCGSNPKETALKEFINIHVERVKPLFEKANVTYWDAAITGEDSLYHKYSQMELKIRKIYSDSTDFHFLKNLKSSGQIKDPVLARQLNLLLNEYLRNQIEPVLLEKIVTLSAEIEKKFSTFRGTINGEAVTVNEINHILKNETDSKIRKKAWLASKQIGPVVAEDMIRLVKLRNKAAKNLGFDTYHTMALHTSELKIDEINRLFDELYGLTFQSFETLKSELDKKLAAMADIDQNNLKPWHYHDSFFQETPLVYDIDLDTYYRNADIPVLAEKFYAGIGLPIADILENSDLYEKEGKNPHAFCTDIDREGDVRILCNIKPTERWMETMLHESGHGIYDKYQDPDLPFLLREPAHIFTTEAIAMMFGRLSRNGAWMQDMLDLSDTERETIDTVSKKYSRLKQLIFARWAMVMFKFEQELYDNPDQDLNALWWNLKGKYQLLRKPENRNEPDWASKIHFAIAPCYYHNYLLGELLASQLHHCIVHDVLKLEDDKNLSYAGQEEIGQFLKTKVFQKGALYPWNEMIRQATGEPLNPKYFVDQFVK